MTGAQRQERQRVVERAMGDELWAHTTFLGQWYFVAATIRKRAAAYVNIWRASTGGTKHKLKGPLYRADSWRALGGKLYLFMQPPDCWAYNVVRLQGLNELFCLYADGWKPIGMQTFRALQMGHQSHTTIAVECPICAAMMREDPNWLINWS